jgi:hypothetical protein
MAKYQPGDTVMIDGNEAIIRSWPDDDKGPYVATRVDRNAIIFMNLHTEVSKALEPFHEAPEVTLVKKGKGKAPALPDPGPDDDAAEPVVDGAE